MRLTKQSKQEFDYLNTIKKINKMKGTPKYLSKENLLNKKEQKNEDNTNNLLSKDSIFNENIPIKVRLIKAAHLNPNINFNKIHQINKSAKTLKKEINNIENKTKISDLKKRYFKNKKTNLSIKYFKSKKEKGNNKNINENEETNEVNKLNPNNTQNNNNQGDVNKLKKLFFSPKTTDKEKKAAKLINSNNIKIRKYNTGSMSEKEDNNSNSNSNTYNNNYNINTYTNYDSKLSTSKERNLYSTNFTYNKPIKGNLLGNHHSKLNKKEKYSKKMIKTEGNKWGTMSSDNILSYIDNSNNKVKINNSTKTFKEVGNNENMDKIKVDVKNKNKCYNLKTYVESSNNHPPSMQTSKRKNTSPIKVSNYNNNNSFNITNNNYKYIYLSPNKEIVFANVDDDNIEIKLDDLILFEERLNDIYIALNTKNIYDGGASNECVEFIGFYFHSSLNNIFPYFFNGMNKVIIKSAINLELLTIVITYHLSLNPVLLNKLINELKNIISLAKINLYLFIKKIQLFYGEKYTKQNDMYFKTFNYILIQNGFLDCTETQIVQIINKNCYEIVNNLNIILNFYKSIENNYYLDFFELFASISKLEEIGIKNYFKNYVYVNSKNKPKPKYNSIKINKNLSFSENEESNNNIDNLNNNNIFNINNNNVKNNENNNNNPIREKSNSKNKEKDQDIKVILEYNKNKISPPFLKKPNEKKYTLVLDLEETLVSLNQNGNYNLRPGLFSFLNAIKPYYEIVSFTNESKYSSNSIIKQIEARNKYFDYNLYREHLTFHEKEFIKDISKLGRDIKKVIIVDNIANNFKLNHENGIKISPYFGDSSDNDTALFELKKLLIMFYKSGYEDLRIAIKKYSEDIKKNISLENGE